MRSKATNKWRLWLWRIVTKCGHFTCDLLCVWNREPRQNKAEDRTPVVTDRVNSTQNQWWAKRWTNLCVCVCRQLPSTHFEFRRGPNLYRPLKALVNWRCYNMITHRILSVFPKHCLPRLVSWINTLVATKDIMVYFQQTDGNSVREKGIGRWPQATTDIPITPLVCWTVQN